MNPDQPVPITTPSPEPTPVPPQSPIYAVVLIAFGILLLGVAGYGLGIIGHSTPSVPNDQHLATSTTPTSAAAAVVRATSPSTTPSGPKEYSRPSLKGEIIYDTYGHNSPHVGDNIDVDQGALVSSSHPTAFAGMSDDATVIYFVETVDTTATVFRRNLTTQALSQLFTYTSGEKNSTMLYENVTVSPKGNYIAYGHDNGDISLYDLKTNKSRVLLTHLDCSSNLQQCYGYYAPRWSPDEKKLAVQKQFFESATEVVVDPFATKTTEHNLLGGTPVWSDTSDSIFTYGNSSGPGSLYAITNLDAATPTRIDVLKGTPYEGMQVTGAVLDDTGAVIFSYAPFQGKNATYGIARYTPANQSVSLYGTFKQQQDVVGVGGHTAVWLRDTHKTISLYSIPSGEHAVLPLESDIIFAIIPE